MCDWTADSLLLLVRVAGEGTRELVGFAPGTELDVLCGLGNGFDTADCGPNPILIGGGVGAAPLFGLARRLLAQGVVPTAALGFRTAADAFYLDKFAALGCRVLPATEDGSLGCKGFVTDALRELLSAGKTYDEVIAIGPIPMMKAVCEMTRPYGIKTIVSMNSVMIDGTGMCGCCRLTVNGETRFACVDGPEFDGHQVDFDGAARRGRMYRAEEALAVETHICHLTGEVR